MSLQSSIDAVAKAVALADTADLPGLVRLQEGLLQLAEEAAGADLDPISEVSAHAAELVERLVLRETADVAQALRTLGEAIEFAQRVHDLDERGESARHLRSPFDASATDSASPRPLSADGQSPSDSEPVVLVAADPASLAEFLSESREHLAAAEAAVLALDRNAGDTEELHRLFRAFHTIKGVAGFLALEPIVDLAHAAETLLAGVRDGDAPLDRTALDLVLASADLLSRLLQALSGGPPPLRGEIRRLVERLAGAASGKTAAPPQPVASPMPSPGSKTGPAVAGSPAEQAVKVSTARMDRLLDTVGELVIAQLMVIQDPAISAIPEQRTQRNLAHLATIVRDLQAMAMGLRMVTLRSTFQRMQRLVRDLAARSGKRIELAVEGEDTELDRTVVEQIADPLVHMVRNACDHGLEAEAERIAAGKPPVGRLTLRAFHRGGMIVIEVQDDGRGLRRDRILAKCAERGLLPADRHPDSLSDDEVRGFIFRPGFSTADQVTDLSGRGVGLDVVKRNIEILRGSISISSIEGGGSTFSMQLPLTMAIIDGMVVRVGTERYVLPTHAIERSFRAPPQSVRTIFGRGELVDVRGELLPVRRLKRIFGLREGVDAASDGLFVVLGSGPRRAALLVDAILGQQQVVIKSLGAAGDPAGDGARGISGGAILGDGRVALILDVDGGLLDAEAEPPPSTELFEVLASRPLPSPQVAA